MLSDFKIYRKFRGGKWVKVREKTLYHSIPLDYWVTEEYYKEHTYFYHSLKTENYSDKKIKV